MAKWEIAGYYNWLDYYYVDPENEDRWIKTTNLDLETRVVETDDDEPPADLITEKGCAKDVHTSLEDWGDNVINYEVNSWSRPKDTFMSDYSGISEDEIDEIEDLAYSEWEPTNLNDCADDYYFEGFMSIRRRDETDSNGDAAEKGLADSADKALVALIDENGVLVIPEGTQKISDFALKGCKEVKSVIIPDGVTRIGWNAFEGCSNLQSITIPDSVTYIGGAAFSNCSSLTSIVIPDGVEIIFDFLFERCESLEEVKLPEKCLAIRAMAFERCGSLDKIKIPDNVRIYFDDIFLNCDSIEIDAPSHLKDMENRCVFAEIIWREV